VVIISILVEWHRYGIQALTVDEFCKLQLRKLTWLAGGIMVMLIHGRFWRTESIWGGSVVVGINAVMW